MQASSALDPSEVKSGELLSTNDDGSREDSEFEPISLSWRESSLAFLVSCLMRALAPQYRSQD